MNTYTYALCLRPREHGVRLGAGHRVRPHLRVCHQGRQREREREREE